ncbi:MAG: metallophosphoesterase [Anaerolineae bacterium]|nr:metallophosphoesterase [Anaerolineae bacterium]
MAPHVLADASTARLISLDSGVAMVVTDLHGDWPLYQHIRDLFLKLHRRGLVHTWIITGDIIHSEGPADRDQSLAIVLDLIKLEQALGEDLVVLLGNHEMPHIYHVPLAKGDTVFTPRFEREMGTHRDAILAFFRRCPFFVRTAAGVTICHAGGFPEAGDATAMATLLTYSHEGLLDGVNAELATTYRPALRAAIAETTGVPYRKLAKDYLAIEDPTDPRYDDYLIGILAGYQDDFKLLWSMLFSQNEHDVGMAAYADQVSALLRALSDNYRPQRVLVSGHIGADDGYSILAQGQHLRVASGAHAHPYTSARYLIFDAAVPVAGADDLRPGLLRIFGDE